MNGDSAAKKKHSVCLNIGDFLFTTVGEKAEKLMTVLHINTTAATARRLQCSSSVSSEELSFV